MAGDDNIQDSARVLHQGKASRDSTLLPAAVLVNSGPAYQGPPLSGPTKRNTGQTPGTGPALEPPLCSSSQARASAAVVASTPKAPLSLQSHQHSQRGGLQQRVVFDHKELHRSTRN